MYNWNLPILILLCVLNTIEADTSLVDGRQYSRERSLRSIYPDTRSFAHRNIRLTKDFMETAVREEYQDLPISQEDRRESKTRTEQSRNDIRGLSRFQTSDRLSIRQREAVINHYSRLVRNRVLSKERLENYNERRSPRTLNHLRTRSHIREMHGNERMPSLRRFNGIREENMQKVDRVSSISNDKIFRSSEVLQRVSRDINNRDSSSLLRKSDDKMRKTNARELNRQNRASLKNIDKQTTNEYTYDEQRESEQIRNHRSINRDIQRRTQSNVENIRRERDIRNKPSMTYEIRPNLSKRSVSRVRDISSRSSERINFTPKEPTSSFGLERENPERYTTVRHTRNARENRRSSDVVRGILRSLERMNVRDTERNVRAEMRDESAAPERTRQFVRAINRSSHSNQRESIDIVRRETAQNRDARLANQRTLRDQTTHDTNRNSMDIRINDNTFIRSRSAERLKDTTETRRNSLRCNVDRTERQQRTGNTRSLKNTRLDDPRSLRPISRGYDQDTRTRQNMNRRLNNSADRMGQLGIGHLRESRLENVEKNKQRGWNFEYSRKMLSNNGDEGTYNWQAAFYALQTIYICSIIFKLWNKTDSTKKKTWSLSWLTVPVNKID